MEVVVGGVIYRDQIVDIMYRHDERKIQKNCLINRKYKCYGRISCVFVINNSHKQFLKSENVLTTRFPTVFWRPLAFE